MKENPQDSPAEKSDSSPVGKTHFAKLFAVGVLGWLVGMAVLFGLAWPMSGVTTVPSALIWAASHGWAGFLFGFLCLLGFGKIARLPLARAAAAYLLPGLLLGIVAGICLLIYPDRALREDLLTYLSLVFLFYVFGSLWTVMRNEDGEAPAMLRAVIPALVGGVVVMAFVTVPAFASDAFRYRDAFELTIVKSTVEKGSMVTEATLEIRKPGSYEFLAPYYPGFLMESENELEPQMEFGELTWGAAGAPKGDVAGVFPVTIRWNTVGGGGDQADIMPYEDYFCIEVHNVDDAGKLIWTLPVSTME